MTTAETLVLLQDKEIAQLQKENERLREALVIITSKRRPLSFALGM